MPNSHPLREASRALSEARLNSEKEYYAVVSELGSAMYRIRLILAHAGPAAEQRLGAALHLLRMQASEALQLAMTEIDAAIAAEIDRIEAALADDEAAAADVSTRPAASIPPIPVVVPEPPLPDGFTYVDVSHLTVHPSTIDVDTPRQGELPDCFFIGALCAVADKRPEQLRNAVVDHGTTVAITFSGTTIEVDKTLPVDENSMHRFAHSSDGTTMVPLLEKALAHSKHGYPNIEAGDPGLALAMITGRPISILVINEQTHDQYLRDICSTDRPTVAATVLFSGDKPRKEIAMEYQIVEGHAYAVEGVDENGDIRLHNPWGIFPPNPLPPAVFRQLFFYLGWCE